jgi:hypothetical protein
MEAQYTISELLSYTTSREKKLDSPLSRKKYATFCNSVSIKLIQIESLQSSLEICLKGLSATQKFTQGPLKEKL